MNKRCECHFEEREIDGGKFVTYGYICKKCGGHFSNLGMGYNAELPKGTDDKRPTGISNGTIRPTFLIAGYNKLTDEDIQEMGLSHLYEIYKDGQWFPLEEEKVNDK